MAEEREEKDNAWVIVGVCIAAIILLVVLLKKDETRHLQSGAVAELQKETFSRIEARHQQNSLPPKASKKNSPAITIEETK